MANLTSAYFSTTRNIKHLMARYHIDFIKVLRFEFQHKYQLCNISWGMYLYPDEISNIVDFLNISLGDHYDLAKNIRF